ncbi:MAG TPA: hypothetical protein VGG84_03785 [Gemmatimonadaceae bacterium]
MTIGGRVDRERRHVRRVELLAGGLLGAGLCALALGLASALFAQSRWLALPRPAPLVVWVAIGAALIALAMHTRRRLARGASRPGVAQAIEREQGLRRGMLLGAMELEGQGALASRAASAAQASLPEDAALAPTLRRAARRRGVIASAVAAVGALVLLTATPLFGKDGLLAVLRPIDAWRGALLEPLRIGGAPRELLRGSPLELSIHGEKGRRRIFLDVRQTGEAWRVDTIYPDPRGGTPAWTLKALRGDVRLVASDGRSSSDAVVVHAVDRPFVGAVAIHATYPAYLGRPAESLPVGESLRLPRGTVLAISGRASVPLASVSLADDRQTFALAANGHSFAGRLVATQSMRLRWNAVSAGSVPPDLPPALDIDVLPDSAPHVAVTAPTGDTILATDTAATLALVASDDHGLASVALRLMRGPASSSIRQAVAGAAGTSWVGPATVDIAGLRLQPGESVRVRAEAVDASPWAQVGVSRELVIRRATTEELRAGARALGDSAVKQANAAAAAQRSLAQRTDEAARAQARQGKSAGQESAASAASGAQKSGMTYENAEKARALAQEQRAMTDRVQKLRDATRNLEQQLKAAGALDSSLARQLSEAQALLRQALTPQMLAQMQKLDNAAGQLSGDQSRDALRDLAQMQQRMKEQLERSAEMLKRAAHEGAMQTLGDQAAELAAKQKALADSASHGGADSKAGESHEAAKLAEQSARLRDEMQALQERLAKDRADAGAARTEQAKDHASKSETGMRRAATDPRAGERARDAAGEMENAAKSMRDARSAQVGEWKKELTAELDQAVQEMMQLSREERSLEQKSRAGASNEERRSAQSAVEQGVDKTNERLQGAGRKSALLSPRSQRAVGEAKDKVSQATQSVSQPQGNASQQTGALGEAADALTRAAAALARDRERANSAQSASGFGEMLEQMRDAAQKQGQINAQAQGLFGMPNGTGGGAGQALARQLARQQRGVADQLDEAGDATGGDRAAQLAREARQLAETLEGGRLDAGTLARQQQLFRRLLDAGRSLEKDERDDSGKREATSAIPGETFTPGTRVDAKAAVRFRPPTWEELRALTPEERRTILDYFTRLNSAPAP